MEITSIIISTKFKEQKGGRLARAWRWFTLQVWLWVNVQAVLLKARCVAQELNEKQENYKIISIRLNVQPTIIHDKPAS